MQVEGRCAQAREADGARRERGAQGSGPLCGARHVAGCGSHHLHRRHPPLTGIQPQMRKPLGMDDLGEQFREQVCRIVNTRNVVDVDAPFVDAVAYVVCANVDMFHLQM